MGTTQHKCSMSLLTSELVKFRKPASTSASACPCIYLCVRPCIDLCIRPCVGPCVPTCIGLCVSLCAVGLRTARITAVSESEVKTPSGARMIG
jgi:hypothetical protein